MHVNTFYNLAKCQHAWFLKYVPFGRLPERMEWRKASKRFGPCHQDRLTFGETYPLFLRPSPASSLSSLTHAQTRHQQHRDTIEWDLWAQLVYLNGQKLAPVLTTGRPWGLWAHEEITVKSYQAFNSLWVSHGAPLALRGALTTCTWHWRKSNYCLLLTKARLLVLLRLNV